MYVVDESCSWVHYNCVLMELGSARYVKLTKQQRNQHCQLTDTELVEVVDDVAGFQIK